MLAFMAPPTSAAVACHLFFGMIASSFFLEQSPSDAKATANIMTLLLSQELNGKVFPNHIK